jgi:NADP-dependent 3-hydroxy acid dehydrogenase YdfG
VIIVPKTKKMPTSLKDQAVFISGASSGFGADAARLLARQAGGKLQVVELDISGLRQPEGTVRNTLERYGKASVLGHNAGVAGLEWLEQLDPEKDIQILPSMPARHSGTILTLSSLAGWIAPWLFSIHASSRDGVHAFMDALRRQVSLFGVAACGIEPGRASTKFSRHSPKAPTRLVFKRTARLNMTSADVTRRIVDLARHPPRSCFSLVLVPPGGLV